MGLEKKDSEKRLQSLKIKHEEEVGNWQRVYKKAKAESRQDIDGLSKGYEFKLRELQNEIKGLQENSREKDHQIRELNKGMEIGNAHVRELQDELNNYKQKYHNLEVKENKAKQRIQELHQHGSSSEVKELRQYVHQIEAKKNAYLEQIQQKENELTKIKQSAVIEHNKVLEASRQEIMDLGNAEYERRMGEKDKEVQELKQKYSELENQYNELKFDYDYAGEQFDKRVNRAANTRALMITSEKDQKIQRLQE